MAAAVGVQMFRRSLLMKLISPRYTVTREKSSLWNPDYLEEAKSKFPEYIKTNIQIKGHDYAILENYQRKIHWVSKVLDLNVSDTWPQEYQKLKVIRYKPKCEIPETEFVLKHYERNVQVSDVYSYQMGTLIDLVISMCPAGVTVQFHLHKESDYENRFVPEFRLLELKDMLNELNNQK